VLRHCAPGALRVLIYHGPTRALTAETLADYDVVLTTYSVLEVEWRKMVEPTKSECPYCGKVAPELVELQRSNPKIKFLFKNYPISDVCNDQVEGGRHENACNAAYAGECARQQGRFWQLDELMFKNQEFLAPADILFMADQLKLDKEAFANCLRDPRTVAAIKADVAAAAKVKVTGTPAIFMHGLAGDTWVQVNGFGDEIRALIAAKEAGTLPPPPPWSDPH
jgi:protein-disulfide isomerase